MKILRILPLIFLARFASSSESELPIGDAIKFPTKRLIHYYDQFTCYQKADDSEPSIKEQCKNSCIPNTDPKVTSATTCWFGNSKWLDVSSGKALEDQFRNIPPLALKTGFCGCNDPIIIFAGKFFIKAVEEMGKVLEKVVCPALQALDIVIEFGSLAIPPPGKAIQGGMIAAVKTAKIYKYAYHAQDAAQEWANMIFGGLSLSKEAGCGEPPFSISKLVGAFLDFANVPDETVPGGIDYQNLPCPKGGCKGTRYREKPGHDKPKSIAPNKPSVTQEKPIPTSDKTSPTPLKSSLHPVISTSIKMESSPTLSKPTTSSSKVKEASKTSALTSSFKPSATARADCQILGENLERLQLTKELDQALNDPRFTNQTDLKSATACPQDAAWKIDSFMSPSIENLEADNVKYGWKDPYSCTQYTWRNGTSEEVLDRNSTYEIDHVLEWQVIVNFFTAMNEKFEKDEFVHPDPNMNGIKVNFCKYWKASWNFKGGQMIDNPAPESGVQSNTQRRKPIDWIAANYPHKAQDGENFLQELTLLQKLLHSPVKRHLFSNSPIVDDGEMIAYITRKKNGTQPQDAPRIAIQYLRSVVGVFHYMQDEKVAQIFKDQKVRIGTVIDGIDNSLAATPKKITKKTTRTFEPWTPLGLGEKWDDYMDGVFTQAKDKGIKFVEDNLERLKDQYISQKAKDAAKDDPKKSNRERNEIAEWARLRENIEDMISKLEADWNKAKKWEKPW